MKNTQSPRSLTSFVLVILALALALSGCSGDEGNPENNATGYVAGCTGKCDSTDGYGFRPISGLTLVGEEFEDPSDDTADAGMADAGSSDAGFADAGTADAGVEDAGSDDAGVEDAGSDDTGSDDTGSDNTGSDDAPSSFRIVATVGADHLEQIDAEQAVSAKIWTTTGETTTDDPLTVDLTWDADQATFSSQTIDGSVRDGVDTLTVRVSGDIGDESFEQTFEFIPGEADGEEILPDPFSAALDVDQGVIVIDPALDAPSYEYPRTDSQFGLSGTEFWQKWPGGHNPTYSYSEGTEAGRKCMYASARRFEAIMADAPEALVELEETSNWSGRFFNWNDDYSHEDANGSARGAVLWAWRTTLIKWISQTGDNGRCYLPTRSTVERAAQNCLQKAASSDGEIEGCQGY